MRSDFQDQIADLVRDLDSVLSSEESDRALDLAVTRYSEDKPLDLIEDLSASADGTRIDLPASFVFGFSDIVSIEYPLAETPPAYIRGEVYSTPLGHQLDLSTSVVSADTLRITFTIRHTLTGVEDTIPIEHRSAVAHYAAALSCAQLAARYAHDSDSTIGADTVDHKSKSEKFSSLSRKYEAMYFSELGISKNRKPAAAVVVDLDRNLSRGGDRIFHSRKYR